VDTRGDGPDPATRAEQSSQGDASGTSESITLENLGKQYPDGTVAVEKLDLTVAAGEVVVLIGPSGCGKSTVLRMINRLVEPTSGRVLLGHEDISGSDPVQLRRRMGYVIQNVGLFPHQTVATNVGTVPRLLGWPAQRVRERTESLLDLVGLDEFHGRRYPHELSGGQRQRVGVARALAADPVVLLMDEPFSAVDPIARARLQEEFLALQQRVRKTIVLVTHDLDEAVRLGDRIAVLSQHGHLEQYADPLTLLGRPQTPFVHEFVGADRAIRRLSVTPVTTEMLQRLPDGADATALPEIPLGASLYDALAAALASGADAVVVTDGGVPLGVVSRGQVFEAQATDGDAA